MRNLKKFLTLFVVCISVLMPCFANFDNYVTSRNMVNEMIYIAEQTVSESSNMVFLDDAYSHLYNNLNLKLIDDDTREQVKSLLGTIENYRMLDIKRKRLDIIYDYKKSAAVAEAIPNPINLIGSIAMFASNPAGAVAGLIGTAASSALMYKAADDDLNLEMLQMRWELDDASRTNMVAMNKNLFDYVSSFANRNQIDTQYFLNENMVNSFVANVHDGNIDRAIKSLESNQNNLAFFPTYWLELADMYYRAGNYRGCLEAIDYYQTHFDYQELYRNNYRYAQVLVDGVDSIFELYGNSSEYVEVIQSWLSIISDNTKEEDWLQRYYVASVYLSLVNGVNADEFLKKAEDLIVININYFSKEQELLNREYLEPIKDVENPKIKDDRYKEEKAYVKELKDLRKTELPTLNAAYVTNLRMLYSILMASGRGIEGFKDYSYLEDTIPILPLNIALFDSAFHVELGNDMGPFRNMLGKLLRYDWVTTPSWLMPLHFVLLHNYLDNLSVYKSAVGNTFTFTLPVAFLTELSEFEISFDDTGSDNKWLPLYFDDSPFKKDYVKSEYAGHVYVKKVDRPSDTCSFDEITVDICIKLNKEFKDEWKDAKTLSLKINTADCPMIFCYSGEKLSKLEFTDLKIDLSTPSYFNNFRI